MSTTNAEWFTSEQHDEHLDQILSPLLRDELLDLVDTFLWLLRDTDLITIQRILKATQPYKEKLRYRRMLWFRLREWEVRRPQVPQTAPELE